MTKLTQAIVRSQLPGCVRMRSTLGEHRVAFTSDAIKQMLPETEGLDSTLRHAKIEATAYYTDDLQDALDTGIAMAQSFETWKSE